MIKILYVIFGFDAINLLPVTYNKYEVADRGDVMRRKISLLLAGVFFSLLLAGCRLVRIEEGEITPLEYTVVNQENIPKEITALVEEKKEKEFQLTYQSGKELYLIKGYGRQMSGGYSISVEELGLSGEAVFFKTKLTGPPDTSLGGEPSYPYIVVKMQYRREPVEFR